QRPEARPGEDRLGDDCAAEEVADLDADDRQYRNGGVPQHVTPDDTGAGEPLRHRRADVILSQLFQDAGAGEPRDERRDVGSDGHAGEHELNEAPPARRRQESPPHGEDQDEQDPPPERREGLADERDRGGGQVAHPAHARGGEDPDRHAEADAMARATTASSSDAGIRSRTSSPTGRCCWIDQPRSARSQARRYKRYCTGIGRSRPQACRASATISGVACSPTSSRTGSPGTMRTRTKTTSETP